MKLKDIKGFEGLYAITEDGRVWSYLKNKWLTPSNNRGYKHVNLHNDGKIKMFLIHRLVYETFRGPIPPGMTVDHIDGCKDNNHILNLQLLTRGDNSRKACKGKKLTEYIKRKISESLKGKTKSLEWRRKISESNKRTKALRKLNA